MEQILPVLNTEILQEKANEYAMKGAMDAIKDYYTGYDSPYKKALLESLKNKGVDNTIEVPDIIGILNQSITSEIDAIANNAVSKSFIPLVKNFLTRADAEMKLSDILKEFINYSGYEYNNDLNPDDFYLEVKKDEGSFVYLIINNAKEKFELHFYLKSKKDESPKVYEIYTLLQVLDSSSRYSGLTSQKMVVKLDGVSLELPFMPNVLSNEFMSYIARLVIANTKITFDIDNFDEDLFPERNECHCD